MLSRSQLRKLAVLAALLVSLPLTSWLLQRAPESPGRPRQISPSLASPAEMERIYHDTCDLLARHYYEPRRLTNLSEWRRKYDGRLRQPQELSDALWAMLQANTDDQSSFLRDDQYAYASLRNAKDDTMLGIKLDNHRRVVVIEGAAATSGVQRGDKLLFLNGRNVDAFDQTKLYPLLDAGPAGSAASLTVLRGDPPQQLQFTVARTVQKQQLLKASYETEGKTQSWQSAQDPEQFADGRHVKLATIELSMLRNPGIVQALVDEIAVCKRIGIEGICIDLTAMSGGDPETIARLAALFRHDGELVRFQECDWPEPVLHTYALRYGKLVYERTCGNRKPVVMIIDSPIHVWEGPLAVAYNEGTKGGAEALAQALRGRAFICGDKSGHVPLLPIGYRVSHQHYLSMLAGWYCRLDGERMNGLTPDAPKIVTGAGYGIGWGKQLLARTVLKREEEDRERKEKQQQ